MMLHGKRYLFAFLVGVFLLSSCTEDQLVDALVPTYYGYNHQFHVPGCTVIQGVPGGVLRRFASRDAALAAGLVPCPVCTP